MSRSRKLCTGLRLRFLFFFLRLRSWPPLLRRSLFPLGMLAAAFGIFWVIANEGRDFPLNDRLGEVKAPTLIIWGRHDRLLDVSCGSVLEAGSAGSQSHIFEHVGHVPMIEDPKATAEVQRAFLASH